MLRFLSRFQADFWLISEWIEPFDWVGMLRFRQSYNVDYYDVQRFDDGDITIHELINGAFVPEEQVNTKQAELLGSVLVAAMGGPAHAHVGTGGGGSIDHSPWNDKDKRKGVKR